MIDVLRSHVRQYVERDAPPPRVRGVLAQLSLCRTRALGGQRFQCQRCGTEHGVYHSCGVRCCPLCRGAARANWQQQMEASLLPTAYFQGVFTLPKDLSALTLGNRRALYNLLLQTAAAAFAQRLAEERGIAAGTQLVLHTWDQRLEAHAHVHLLHPAGGLSLCGTRWIECPQIQRGRLRGKLYLVDNRKLSRAFRDLFLKGLDRLRRRGELKLEGEWSRLLDDDAWEQFLEPLRAQDWAVYLQPPPVRHATAENLLKYLARYVTGGPIGDARLISHANGFVTFWARDKSKTGHRVPVRLAGVEFVRRWSLHILPQGCHRVRYYGELHPSRRQAYLARCRELLAKAQDAPPVAAVGAASEAPSAEAMSPRSLIKQGLCPNCGGELRLLESRPQRPSWRDVLSSSRAPGWYRIADS